uniref:Uncharacterized protein n=1 Tax=Chloropicon laureae TaxID=464258 RepID=A0A7S2Z713_9CHLO|mmetsp:Transcript_715/g.1831  ORF Transcript_715/g.1831 Transcript_715/m.1831 type:complete len:142 (+) Transcript_715:387-812(+)
MLTFSTGEAAAGLDSAALAWFSASSICMDIMATPENKKTRKEKRETESAHVSAKRRGDGMRALFFFFFLELRKGGVAFKRVVRDFLFFFFQRGRQGQAERTRTNADAGTGERDQAEEAQGGVHGQVSGHLCFVCGGRGGLR